VIEPVEQAHLLNQHALPDSTSDPEEAQ
jgi:hypothetical protein